MKLITKDTDYAIRALICIAGSGGKMVTVTDLAKELDIPHPFLRKILQKLNKRGILKSYKGKTGGFILAVAPEKIDIFNIIEILQGPFKLNDHIFKGKTCPNLKKCKFKKELDNIEKKLRNDFEKITIFSLLKKGNE